jgi:PHO85 cyclin-5
MAFLLAVSWRLHITDDVFQRWTDIVLKYTPSLPPSPGAISSRAAADLSASWKSIILELTPELDNVEGISSPTPAKATVQSISASSAKPFFERTCGFESESNESTPTPRYYAPHVMEPSPLTAYPPTKPAPAFGLLPTPRLTPQSIGFSTPAVSAASYMLSKSSMGYAMAQASTVCATQSTERWPCQNTMSPQGLTALRRSSLATSVSSVSSPESMISDNSTRSSRSSSISSASSLMSAPLSSKLDVQARCRYAKQCCDRTNNRTIIATVPESCVDMGPTSSPESYTGIVGKDFLELSLENRLTQSCNADYFSRDSSANDAARALQELHNNPRSDDISQLSSRAGAKRSRPQSIDNSLHENVRDMLSSSFRVASSESWSESLVRPRRNSRSIAYNSAHASARSVSRGADGRKRVCCSTEASNSFPEPGLLARPGMWEGILN